MSGFRQLSSAEINDLKNNGCTCADWGEIRVGAEFSTSTIRQTAFSGKIFLGGKNAAGIQITNCEIDNCRISENVALRDVPGGIRNYTIHEGVRVCGVNRIAMSGSSSFGNGEKIVVMIESGGREVVMHESLSAQEAYLQCFVRADDAAHKALQNMALKEARKRNESCGIIGASAEIADCGLIENTAFGAKSSVIGCRHLRNSTINGTVRHAEAIRESIVSANASIGAGCLLTRCFLADGSSIGEGFCAENSIFCANSEGLRGEACSAFAGPFTVSHHKATLLLAGLYSFYNAGSGANFSNHRYKLGALHQGVLERGCKSGSGSYLLWPCRIGAFTNVIGRHTNTIDSAEFPFAVLLEQNGRSLLLPGANLFSAGLERDLGKWQKRDRRGKSSHDLINFKGFSPLSATALNNGLRIMKNLGPGNDSLLHRGAEIPASYLNKAIARYHAAINFYYGEVLSANLGRDGAPPAPETMAGIREWVDICGMLAPREEVAQLIDDLGAGRVSEHTDLLGRLRLIDANYVKFEWNWLCFRLTGQPRQAPERGMVQAITENWLAAAKIRCEMVVRDAGKEFAADMQTGFGLLSGAGEDFVSVRGDLESDELIQTIRRQTDEIAMRAREILASS